MGRILFFLVALAAVALAVLLFLPGLIPVAAFKGQIETQASASVGREVTIGDDLTFRIFPRTAFHVTDLKIDNAEGFEGDYLLTVEEADIGVKLIPLLSKAVEIDRFILTKPDIRLARKKNGEVNWNLAAQQAADEADAAGASEMRELKLGDVRIVDGAARYADAAAARDYVAENINLAIVLKSLSEPLEARGTMTFQGEPSKVDIVLTSLADMMRNEPSNLKLNVTVGDTSAGADLAITNKNGVHYAGPVTFDAPDLPAFAALAGTELADAPGFDKLSVKGDVDGNDKAMRLENASIGFDDIAAQGAMTLNWAGARPKASGVLSTDKLDLRPYMPPPPESPQGFPAWSEARMDFASLRNIDADFDISTNAVYVNDLEFGESRIKLTIEAGRMTAEIPELSMYGGQGSGRLVVNARSATPTFAGNFDVGSVQAQPLSTDLFRNDNLLGLGSFKLNFTATGDSQAAIMNSMDGSGGFDLADGALKGINIAAIVRGAAKLTEGLNPAAFQAAITEARGPSQQTDFSEFLSDFSMTDGLINVPTINLNGPYLTMTGKGTINLGAQTIDLKIAPRASTSLEAEGGRMVTIPLRVGGTFAKPTIVPDMEAIAKSGLQRTLQNVLTNKNQSTEEGGATTEEKEEVTPESLLKGFIGGGQKKETPAPADDPDAAAQTTDKSTEDQLIEQGINSLFNKLGKSKQESAPEEESTPQ